MLNIDEPGVPIRQVIRGRELRLLIDHDINALLASPFGAQLRAGRVAQRVASFET
jgi:hypothetical protein